MEGLVLRFYVRENQRHHSVLLWQWLLDQANHQRIRGGSAFRALAGFGRHHQLHEDHFLELAGTLTVEVEFIVTAAEARELLELLRSEGIHLFYTETPTRFGITGDDAAAAGPAAQA